MRAVKSPIRKIGVWPSSWRTLELLEHHRVAQMQVGRGRIHTELDAEGPTCGRAPSEPRAKLVLAVELDAAAAHDVELALHLASQSLVLHICLPGIATQPRSVTMASTRRSREPCGTDSSSWNDQASPTSSGAGRPTRKVAS